MSPLQAGSPVPSFSLRRAGDATFTEADLAGQTTVLVFYPFAFSPVCTDQLNLYDELRDEFAAQGATLYGVSCDAVWSQAAFKQSLGVEIEQLSDFEPKGAACRAFGVYHPGGFPQRALVIIGPDATVKWSYQADSPGDLPGANLIFRRPPSRLTAGARQMRDLRSAPVPGLSAEDHVRGPDGAPLLIEYADLECAYCAALHVRTEELAKRIPLRLVCRHFPVRSAHPRAWAAACATEAAALQGRFWEMHDAILADQGHMEDPHLWSLAEGMGLDVERFDADRRGEAVAERVRRDFSAGVRAGVVTTPTVFRDGAAFSGERLRQMLAGLVS